MFEVKDGEGWKLDIEGMKQRNLDTYIGEASMVCNESISVEEFEEKRDNSPGGKYHLRRKQVHDCKAKDTYMTYNRNKYGDKYSSAN